MMEYIPIKGFYDLRNFVIPKKEFEKIYKMQKFLANIESNKEYYIKHSQRSWQLAQEISAKLSFIINSYPLAEALS